MTLRTKGGRATAESVDDLARWLGDLAGCPPVNRTVTATCAGSQHADEPGTWFYVEADRVEGVARLRCLSCGLAKPLFDSEARWTFPAAWCCGACGQSIAEVVHGLHVEDGQRVTWVALGVRCVNCGDLAGAADFVLPGSGQPVDEVLAAL